MEIPDVFNGDDDYPMPIQPGPAEPGSGMGFEEMVGRAQSAGSSNQNDGAPVVRRYVDTLGEPNSGLFEGITTIGDEPVATPFAPQVMPASSSRPDAVTAARSALQQTTAQMRTAGGNDFGAPNDGSVSPAHAKEGFEPARKGFLSKLNPFNWIVEKPKGDPQAGKPETPKP